MMLTLSASSLYLEARDEYLELRKTHSIEDAISIFMKTMEDEMNEETDRCFCIAGLARAQAYRRELTHTVIDELDHALQEIASQYAKDGYSLSKRDINYFTRCVGDPTYYASKIDTKAAPKRTQQRGYRCKWAIGDTFAFQLNSQTAKDVGIAGKTCVIRKVDQEEKDRYGLAATFPIVYATIIGKPEEITDVASLEKAGYLIIWDRYFTRKGKYEYRIVIRIKNQRKLDGYGFVYLGNYKEARIPKDELKMIHWQVPQPSTKGCTPPPEVELDELEEKICSLYLEYGIVHPELIPYDSIIEEK